VTFPLRREDVNFPAFISKEGTFGFKRKHDVHTGVDLYTVEGAPVYAVEPGIVVSVERFTGPPESPWWLTTYAVLVEGKSGVLVYGEVESLVSEGQDVEEGQHIARVIPVLPQGKERPDIPGHSRFMLHFEHYDAGTTRTVWWNLGDPQPKGLHDPLPLLAKAWNEQSIQILDKEIDAAKV